MAIAQGELIPAACCALLWFARRLCRFRTLLFIVFFMKSVKGVDAKGDVDTYRVAGDSSMSGAIATVTETVVAASVDHSSCAPVQEGGRSASARHVSHSPPRFKIETANVTCASGLEKLLRETDSHVICIQEHKLLHVGFGKAQKLARERSMECWGGDTRLTPKGGRSSGVGFAWRQDVRVTGLPRMIVPHRLAEMLIKLPAFGELAVYTLYGSCEDESRGGSQASGHCRGRLQHDGCQGFGVAVPLDASASCLQARNIYMFSGRHTFHDRLFRCVCGPRRGPGCAGGEIPDGHCHAQARRRGLGQCAGRTGLRAEVCA